MPLSEHEQRVLEEIERSLLEDDPKFASAVRSADPRHHALRRLVWAAALFLLGVSVLVLGLVTQATPGGIPIVALLGFGIMFFSATLVLRAYRRNSRNGGTVPPSGRRKEGKSRGPRVSMLDRLEERWRRRRGHDSDL